MVSDQEIANGVEVVLRQLDPHAVISVNGVVQQLEAKLGLDLSHKATFIRDQIDLLLRPKDHFALQHHHQFQNHQFQNHQFQNHHPQITSPFPLHHHQPQHLQHHHQHHHQQHHHHHHHHHHEEIEFSGSPPSLPLPKAEPFDPPLSLPLPKDEPFDPTAGTPETPKESTPTGTKRRGGPGGLNKVCGVSPELQVIVGEPTMPRTQIVKQLWAYIRKNKLQDPSNKRKIICNDELRLVFETDCTDMFKMNKLLAKHIITLEPTKDSKPGPKRLKAADVEPKIECTEEGPLVIVSDTLANFFGTGEREMLPSEAIRRVWDYIKVNQLEDPRNSMVILCDTKLQEIFGCESLSALGISEMLAQHFFKRS